MSTTTLTKRAQQVMKLLIERYIADGQPVGSTTLAKAGDLGLSPASIRNVLADLEQQGYLVAPHTSAGRIPTAKGYRFFIDSLLTVKPLEQNVLETCAATLTPDLDQGALLQSATHLLSQMTQLVGVVTINRRNPTVLKQIEFLPLSENRILVVLVLNEKEIQNRIIITDRPYQLSELETASRYLTELYRGQSLNKIRRAIISEMKADRRAMNGVMANLIQAVEKTFNSNELATDAQCWVVGETNLLRAAEQNDVTHLQHLLEAFQQKRNILHLLDQCLSTQGIQIFVGQESGYDALGQCSIITAPYANQQGIIGMLGVIGPTRMSYEQVIPLVDVTARLLTSALNS